MSSSVKPQKKPASAKWGASKQDGISGQKRRDAKRDVVRPGEKKNSLQFRVRNFFSWGLAVLRSFQKKANRCTFQKSIFIEMLRRLKTFGFQFQEFKAKSFLPISLVKNASLKLAFFFHSLHSAAQQDVLRHSKKQ